jgi:hypothetical protein
MSGFYRQPAERPKDPTLAVWPRLRWRRWGMRVAALVIFVAIVPAVALVLAPDDQLPAGIALGLTVALPLSLFVVAIFPRFQCPACGEAFFASPGGELGTSKSCVACGIPVGADSRAPIPRPVAPRPAKAPGPMALAGWLATTLVVVVFGFQIARYAPPLQTMGFALAAAGALTVFVGQTMASTAFPRSLLVPIAAFILSLFLGARVEAPPAHAAARGGHRCDSHASTVKPAP